MLTVQPVLHVTVQPVRPQPHQLQHSYLPVIIVSHLVFTGNPFYCSPSGVYFVLNGQAYGNNSILSLADVGEGINALLCKTNNIKCCGTAPHRYGDFYYPNGVQVPINGLRHGFYRDRKDQEIRLNRRKGVESPAGEFLCQIPDEGGATQRLFVTLV